MAVPTYPGVYVQEVPSGIKTISGESTSTAAFIGAAERRPIGEPMKIYNFNEFQTIFGGFVKSLGYLSHAVYLFFQNGGSQCYVIRVAGPDTQAAKISIKDQASQDKQKSLTISACSEGDWGNYLEVFITDGTRDPANKFNMNVFFEGEKDPAETEVVSFPFEGGEVLWKAFFSRQ